MDGRAGAVILIESDCDNITRIEILGIQSAVPEKISPAFTSMP